ncbi:NAD(P)H-dependent glycerol-3-phosphate dehydrogenase [Pararhodobacter oceanensis]|uniref:NAD(P)H-dependent glycerol-3-phosphate dehydrogenase n=1 Tax=Pararhodobacter oceanensis TaxID=2172121 RepID=UPI003A903810
MPALLPLLGAFAPHSEWEHRLQSPKRAERARMSRPDIGILGAGAFGTALGVALAQAGRRVEIWARDAAQAAAMVDERENKARLPGVALPDGLHATADLGAAAQAPVVLLAVPTQRLRSVVEAHAELLRGRVLIACCKGVEMGSGLLPTQVLTDVLPETTRGVLTGPSFPADIARGKPTALTLAAEGAGAAALQADLATHHLRLYLSDDLVGAQLGGALKNVIAIAAGITIGAGLGESSRAALMTRGFAEISRLAQARGANPQTLLGLSGFGDLVLTCTSDKSRNFRHGVSIGAGAEPDPGQTVEGVMTAHAMAEGADPDEMPVICMVSALLKGEVALREAVDLLLSRPLRFERG